jgi:hypothetical protein
MKLFESKVVFYLFTTDYSPSHTNQLIVINYIRKNIKLTTLYYFYFKFNEHGDLTNSTMWNELWHLHGVSQGKKPMSWLLGR